jgi:hypothetical protein
MRARSDRLELQTVDPRQKRPILSHLGMGKITAPATSSSDTAHWIATRPLAMTD